MKVILSIIMLLLIIGFLLRILICSDDVEEIDNTDHHIICANTDKPCILSVLYTKVNNCSECPFSSDNYVKEN